MSMNYCVSVIIPIYNSEKYLKKCIESVLNQTYSLLDVVLVDDGSIDKSGNICDHYASIDSRVSVIHQANSGVSEARNAGLKAAKGDYISWVDSDDWIETSMIEKMLESIIISNADMAVCGRCEHFRERSLIRNWDKQSVLTKSEAIKLLLLNNQMQNYLWDKLWRKEVFDGVSFPKGKTYEDIAMMDVLFSKLRTVVCVPLVLYHYQQREGSIVDDRSLENRLNHYDASQKRLNRMVYEYPEYKHLLEAQCAASAINIWACYLSNSPEMRNEYKKKIVSISRECKKTYKIALKNLGIGVCGKLILRLTQYPKLWSFLLSDLLSKVYWIKHGRYL